MYIYTYHMHMYMHMYMHVRMHAIFLHLCIYVATYVAIIYTCFQQCCTCSTNSEIDSIKLPNGVGILLTLTESVTLSEDPFKFFTIAAC